MVSVVSLDSNLACTDGVDGDCSSAISDVKAWSVWASWS